VRKPRAQNILTSIILSACETARGRISNGEGVIGMSWASFIAGAPTTVASQWKVESSSTTEVMLEFHRQLLTGKVSKAEALRRASLKVMKMPKYRHPSYWAGWVMVGDGSYRSGNRSPPRGFVERHDPSVIGKRIS
jgi:CHAT domain-containing protein